MYDMYYDNIVDLIGKVCDQIQEINRSNGYNVPRYNVSTTPKRPKFVPTLKEIPIYRVIYSGNKTIVYFNDGSKVVVSCSDNDKYDRQTAIAYAIVKRFFGKVNADGTVDGNGIGIKLEHIANSGYDQDAEDKIAKQKKAEAKAKHIAKQQAEAEAAFNRRVKARAEQLRIERAAEDLLADKKTDLEETKVVLNESTKPEYVRPNKPFSKFTQEEKRAYWNFHSAKRRSKK